MILDHAQMEHAAEISSKVSFAGAGGLVVFGLTANELAALGGLVLAGIGLLVNLYFRIKAHRLIEKTLSGLDPKKAAEVVRVINGIDT